MMDSNIQLQRLQDGGLAGYVLDSVSDANEIMATAAKYGVFAALLEDGRVALSSIDGLPEDIQSAAQCLDVQNDAITPHIRFQSNRQDCTDNPASPPDIDTKTDDCSVVENVRNDMPSWAHDLMTRQAEIEARHSARWDAIDSSLSSIVSRLDQKPDGTVGKVDMAPVHQAIARQATALSQAIARLEAVSAALGHQGQESVEAQVTHETGEWSEEEALGTPDAAAQALSLIEDLHKLVQSCSAQIRHLTQIVHAQPTPAAVLTADRQSFARFGTALNSAISRMEAAAAKLESGNTDDAASLSTIVNAALTRFIQLTDNNLSAPQSSCDIEKLNELIDDLRFATAELAASALRETLKAS